MRKISLFVGSVYGGAEQLAETLKKEIEQAGLKAELYLPGTVHDIINSDIVLIVTSTTGQGDIPSELETVFLELKDQSPTLINKPYGVIALGDSSYVDSFCGAGKQFAALLSQLKAERLADTLLIDAMENFEPEPVAVPWLKGVLAKLV